MNFRALLLVLVLLCMPAALGAQLTRDMPLQAAAGEQVTVTLRLSDISVGSRVVVSELIPEGTALGSWSVGGAQDGSLRFVRDGGSLVWEFIAGIEKPVITYSATMPSSAGTIDFDAVYATPPQEFGRSKVRVSLTPSQGAPAPQGPQPSGALSPAPLAPLVESPEEVVHSLPSVLIPIVLIALLTAAMLLYLHSRIREYRQEGQHLSFVDWFGGRMREQWTVLLMRSQGAVPQECSPAAERSLERFEHDQQRMLERLGQYQDMLPHGDLRTFEMVEDVKRELQGITFAHRDY
jgi:hypothetical protein